MLVAMAAVATTVLAGCTRSDGGEDRTSTTTVDAGFSASALASGVQRLGTAPVVPAPQMRLADGLVPPTNRWFSGLVFGPDLLPVFPSPISYTPTAAGFSGGLPTVTASANGITGPAVAQFGLDVGATGMRVSAYDQVAVTIAHTAAGSVVGHSTIAEGSPSIGYTAATGQTVTPTATITRSSRTTGTATGAGQEWAVVVEGGSIAADGGSITLERSGSVVMFPVPAGARDAEVGTLQRAAASPLTGVELSRSGSSDRQRTVLAYRTAARGDTLVVPQRSQGTSGLHCTGLRYDTIDGSVPLCTGTALRFSAPTVTPTTELDLSALTNGDRAELREQVTADAAGIDASSFAADTYAGGKNLSRAANLYTLADQLGMDRVAARLRTTTVAVLDRWADAKGCLTRTEQCFGYDDTIKGVVGQTASFGSEEFNDHHFHYGYILYAAGVMAAGHQDLVDRWNATMTLVAADIAAPTTTASFPEQRVYDPYAQHSWASGYSPFVDGNNQESTSEAVNAWNGLAAWASAAGDDGLRSEATWLLSNESAAALDDSVAPDISASAFGEADVASYDHDIVSLTWGGKRDYGTWFSALPEAIAGIQLIPMTPAAPAYLGSPAGGGASHIRAVVEAATPNGYGVQFGDYLLMYRSLASAADARRALTTARTLPDVAIDTANTRSYTLAFIMAEARR
ncbi:hypothetical protein ASF23_05505 [Curtobacterium sp. Leaf261]|nr:hypothetical protein ASF23_05505 [Curtobacterium sp. Leaf261]